MMYVFTKVRADMKKTATVRHNAPTATSQFSDEGGSTKLDCCPGGGLRVGVVYGFTPTRSAIALFGQRVYMISWGHSSLED